jgi:hypothetical protein
LDLCCRKPPEWHQAETHSLIELVGKIEHESGDLKNEVERLKFDLQAKEGQHKLSTEQLLAAGQQQQVRGVPPTTTIFISPVTIQNAIGLTHPLVPRVTCTLCYRRCPTTF